MLNDVPWHPKVVGTEFLSIHLLPTYCSFNKYLFDICNWNFARERELEVNQTVIVLDMDLQSSEKDFFLKALLSKCDKESTGIQKSWKGRRKLKVREGKMSQKNRV